MTQVAYGISQNQVRNLDQPAQLLAIGGDNPTPFYLNFPSLPPGMQWVFPFTYGFMYPLGAAQSSVLIDASKIPPGYPPIPTSTAQALLTAYDYPQLYSAGTRSAASPPVSQANAQGNLLSLNDTLSIPCGGASFITFSLVAGAALASGSTINIEGTPDDSNWIAIPWFGLTALGANPIHTWVSLALPGPVATAQPTLLVPTAGLSQVRLRLNPANQGVSPMTWIARAVPGAGAPGSFGTQTGANSQPVVIASDQLAIPVNDFFQYQTTYAFRASGLSSGALGIGASKVILSIWHLAGSTKTVRLRKLKLYVDAISAATAVTAELFRFSATTLPSGGTGITPDPMISGGGAAEVSIQSLPTTVGATEDGIGVAFSKNVYGVLAGSTSDLFRDGYDLYRHALPDAQPPTLPNAVQTGWNLKLTTSAAATLTYSLEGELTEA